MSRSDRNPGTRRIFVVQQPLPGTRLDPTELWRALLRRRRLAASVFAVVLALGILAAVSNTTLHDYRAVVKIIDDRGAVDRLRVVTIPKAMSVLTQSHPELEGRLRVFARMPPGSDLVTLEGRGEERLESAYLDLIGRIARALERRHQRIYSLRLAARRAWVEKHNHTMTRLLDEQRFLRTRVEQLSELNATALKQAKDLRQRIEESLILTPKIQEKAIDESSQLFALGLLLRIQIGRDHEALRELEERTLIGVGIDHTKLEHRIREITQELLEEQSRLSAAKIRLAVLEKPEILVSAARVSNTGGITPVFVLSVSIFLGLICAVLTVWVAETMSRRTTA